METSDDLNFYYSEYSKKMVDSVFKKFSDINSINDPDYWDRFSSILSLKKKNPYTSGKDYFSLLYGDRFKCFWKEKNMKIVTPYKIKYWTNRGFSKDEAVNKIEDYKAKKATNLNNFILAYGEDEGRKKYLHFGVKSKQSSEKWKKKYGDNWEFEWEKYLKSKDSTSFQWALQKCKGDIEKAKLLYENRLESVKINREEKIKELGGISEYEEYMEKINFKKGLRFDDFLRKNGGNYQDAVNEYTLVLKKRRVKFGSASKSSLLYFMSIYNHFSADPENRVFLEIEESSPFFLYDKQHSRSYCYDFCLFNKFAKLIIEFNGIKWHPNLDVYSIDEYKKISVFLKKNEEILEKYHYDRAKERIALDNGFSYLEIWDTDQPEINIQKIEDFFEKNKINYKYETDDKNKINQKGRPRKINLGS
jgi:hypothetical protein